jgi:hypothetical protein
MIGGSSPRKGLGNFLFTTASRPALEPAKPPIQWVPGALPQGVKLTTHLHLVPKSRKHGAMPLLPKYAFVAWYLVKLQGKLYLILTARSHNVT